MRWMIGAVAFAVIATTSSAHAQAPAPSRLDEIVSRGTLRVGMTGDYRPFTHLDKATTTFEGFDVDMANALGQALGVKVEFVPTSWPSMMKDFEANSFDMVAGGVSITLDRQKKGLFSTPIMREGKTPIARCTDAGKFDTLAEIDKPGTARALSIPAAPTSVLPAPTSRTPRSGLYPDNVTIFDEIAKGNADLMMTDSSGDALPAEAAPRRALRGASRQAVRLRREGLLAAARRRTEGLRRPVAAHQHGERQLQEDLRQMV